MSQTNRINEMDGAVADKGAAAGRQPAGGALDRYFMISERGRDRKSVV